jgi:hypothetical protein
MIVHHPSRLAADLHRVNFVQVTISSLTVSE